MKNHLFILLVSLMGGPLFAQTVQGRLSDTKKTPEKVVQEVKKKDSYLIDVRTPEEYQEGHLLYAQNIDYKASDFKQELAKWTGRKPSISIVAQETGVGRQWIHLLFWDLKRCTTLGGLSY